MTRVRKAVSEDADQVAAIYNLYVDRGGATFDVDHQSANMIAQRINAAPPDGWYVAETEVGITGWACSRRFSERYGYRFCCETAIYVLPIEIGTGTGDRLQAAIDQHCIEHQLHHAVARVVADNSRSMAFHYRHGYELVGIQKEVGRLNDAWVDVAILQKLY